MTYAKKKPPVDQEPYITEAEGSVLLGQVSKWGQNRRYAGKPSFRTVKIGRFVMTKKSWVYEFADQLADEQK